MCLQQPLLDLDLGMDTLTCKTMLLQDVTLDSKIVSDHLLVRFNKRI